MHLIKLVNIHGKTVYLNTEHITCIAMHSPNIFEISLGLEQLEINRTKAIPDLDTLVSVLNPPKGVKKTKKNE